MRTLFAFGICWLATSASRAAEPPSLSPDQFVKLHALIKPEGGADKWEQIPWQANLWAARQQAAREGKPILLWEMDGHPLGCV
jgi:hypothetical protein